MNIGGRTKESITVNGVNYIPHELEFAIEEAGIESAAKSFTICFSRRFAGDQTERVCVVYLSTSHADDIHSRIVTQEAITKVIALQTGTKPFVLPLDDSCLEKSSLGRLSRGKVRNSLEKGVYTSYEKFNNEQKTSYCLARYSPPMTKSEKMLSQFFCNVLDLSEGELGKDSPYFETSLTSIDLIKIKSVIEVAFSLPTELRLITLVTQMSIASLAKELDSMEHSLERGVREYNPNVTSHSQGQKTPLLIIHPGVGEILVFLALIKFLDDRPVHAIRARGFNEGEEVFYDLPEILDTYYTAIRKTQVSGPYAVVGYPWGSMVALELAKRLEADGQEVALLGASNLFRHIKWRMRQFD